MAGNRIQQIGALATIPFVLALSPLMGWLIGRWLDKLMNTSPYMMYLFMLLGFMAGVRECYRLIKKYGNDDGSV